MKISYCHRYEPKALTIHSTHQKNTDRFDVLNLNDFDLNGKATCLSQVHITTSEKSNLNCCYCSSINMQCQHSNSKSNDNSFQIAHAKTFSFFLSGHSYEAYFLPCLIF